MDTINKIIIQILSSELGITVDKINLTDHFVEDLNADSIDTMNIIHTINAQLHVNIPPKEAINLKTVNHLIDLVNRKKGSGH
jgi:acyl carrier protein